MNNVFKNDKVFIFMNQSETCIYYVRDLLINNEVKREVTSLKSKEIELFNLREFEDLNLFFIGTIPNPI